MVSRGGSAEATRCLEKAVDLYSEAGRLNMAARYCKVGMLGFDFVIVRVVFFRIAHQLFNSVFLGLLSHCKSLDMLQLLLLFFVVQNRVYVSLRTPC